MEMSDETSRLLNLERVGLNELIDQVDFGPDGGAEILRRAACDLETPLSKTRAHVGRLQCLVGLEVHLLDDRTRRSCGCLQSDPQRRIRRLDSLLGVGRNIR